jgi:hypothetical protein
MGFATIGRVAVDIRNCMVPGATCKVQTESFPDQIQKIQRSCSYMYSKNKTDHNSNIINTQTHKLTRQDKEHKARQRRQKLSILGKVCKTVLPIH